MEPLFHKYLEKARDELSRGQVALAQEAIRSASYMEPGHVDVICCRVEILRFQGFFQEAAECLEEALKRYPYRPWWVLDLAELLINRLQEPALALDWLGRLLHCCELTSPQKLRTFRLQAEAFIDQERWYEASRTLHSALSFFPRNLNLLFLCGWVHLRRGNGYGAASAFHRILRYDPAHADAHYYLGLAFAALDELRLMQCHFEQAYHLDREDPRPTRYSIDTFEQIVLQSLSCESFVDLPDFSLDIQLYPSVEMLEEMGLDPRWCGLFLPPSHTRLSYIGEQQGPILVLFQRNIERFCSSERDIIEEVQRIAFQEFVALGEISLPPDEFIPAVS